MPGSAEGLRILADHKNMKTGNSTEKNRPPDFIDEIEAMLPPEKVLRARREAENEIFRIKTFQKHAWKKKIKE